MLIGEVTSLDVRKNGDLLIADGLSQELWIFDKDGALKKEISPEACHPGDISFFIAPSCATLKNCTNTNKPREKSSSAIHTLHMLKPIAVYGFLCLFAFIGDTAVQGSFEENALPARVTEARQSPSGVKQDRTSVSTDDLENYFRKHRVIELSEEVLIGEVTSMKGLGRCPCSSKSGCITL